MEQEKGAVYCRLSQDDGSAGESGSIQTQRTLLTQYCKEHSIQIVDYYCDDGWSVTNFERPEFKRMIDDIESGKINTVTVVVEEDGVHRSKKPDYSFKVGTEVLYFLETKKPAVNLTIDAAPAFQLRRYGWSGNLKVSVLTNFTDLYILQ